MAARRLHALLPAANLSPLAQRRPEDQKLRKRNSVSSACEQCRARKSKCDGSRPCAACVRRQTECLYASLSHNETHGQALKRKYAELEKRGATLEQLFNLLRHASQHDALTILADIRKEIEPEEIVSKAGHLDSSSSDGTRRRARVFQEIAELLTVLPEADALSVLRRIRARNDLVTIVDHVRAGDVLLQMSVAPESRFRYELPYRSRMPEEYTANNPYLTSLIYEAASLNTDSESPRQPLLTPSDAGDDLSAKAYRNVYLKPFHAAEIIEPRLSDAKVSSWTTVCDDDVLMRNLLGEWLRCEYHFTAIFQKDLFLEDLDSQGGDFCSSLLVNIILGYSCVCYTKFHDRAEYWNPNTLTYRFIAEAKRLWELEAYVPRITTVQAGVLFNVFYNLCGLDEVGQAYRLHAIALAHRMHLFDSTRMERNDRISHGTAFTAWALYDWETLVGFSFMFAPLLHEPPDWHLPEPSEDADWYGEIWVRYPTSNQLVPSYFGQVFRTRTHFRMLMNEACQFAYSQDSKMTLDKANELLLRLREWYNALPSPLLPRSIVLPGHLQLHMYYFHLVLTICEPLLCESPSIHSPLQQVVTQSKKHLYTLIRLYYIRHGFEAMDLFIVIPLMLAASDCIEAINDDTPASTLESLRSTLVLAMKGLYNQRRNHYLAEALFRVIRGRMRPAEIALCRSALGFDHGALNEAPDMAQAVRSNWPVSVVKKMEDLDSHILGSLVQNYAHMNIDSSTDIATEHNEVQVG